MEQLYSQFLVRAAPKTHQPTEEYKSNLNVQHYHYILQEQRYYLDTTAGYICQLITDEEATKLVAKEYGRQEEQE
jgi:hypothetical protein